MASLKMLRPMLGTDGLVENTPSFVAADSVASNWSLNRAYTRQAPTKAPANCAMM